MKMTVLSLAVGLCAAPAVAQMTIERVAPENSVFVMGMPSVETSRERFANTPLYDLWMSDEVKALREDDDMDLFEQLFKFLDDLGVDRNELSLPSGPMGFAFYPTINADTGMPAPAMLGFADFGAKGEATGALMLAMLDRGERDRILEYEVKEILGRTVYEIHFASDDDMDDFDDFDDFDFMMFPDPADLFGDMSTLYYMHDGGIIMLASDLGGITEALDRMDGNARDTLSEREDFRAVMGQIGRDDFYAVLLTRDIMQMISAMDTSGMLMFVQPTIQALFGDIRGYGMSARVDGDQGMLEARYSAYIPAGKVGLMRLMDVNAPRSAIPGFIGPDTVSYSQSHIQFDQVVDIVRSVVNSNPFLQMQAGEIMEMVEGPVAEILATLGSQIHVATTVSRPIQADSVTNLIAIEARDQQQFENLFGQFAPQMGLESRDFLGNRIFSADFGGMMGGGMDTFAVGVGGGHVFAGPIAGVEQAMRSVGQADQMPSLDAEPDYRQSIAALGQRAINGFSFVRFVDMMESSIVSAQLQQREMMERIRRDHPEWADQMGGDDDMPEIDFDLMRRYLGPMIGELRSTDDGYVGSVYFLAPQRDDS